MRIEFLLDRSGSMGQIKSDVIGGFNQFLSEQAAMSRKLNDGATISLTQFDSGNRQEVLYRDALVEIAPRLSDETFKPGSSTPLYDAMGILLSRLLSEPTESRPVYTEQRDYFQPTSKGVVAILTDGLENDSREFSRNRVFDMVEDVKRRGWTVAYLGANQDALAVGGTVGVRAGSTQSFAATPAGTRQAYGSVSHSTSNLRTNSATGQSVNPDNFFVPPLEDEPEDDSSR